MTKTYLVRVLVVGVLVGIGWLTVSPPAYADGVSITITVGDDHRPARFGPGPTGYYGPPQLPLQAPCPTMGPGGWAPGQGGFASAPPAAGAYYGPGYRHIGLHVNNYSSDCPACRSLASGPYGVVDRAGYQYGGVKHYVPKPGYAGDGYRDGYPDGYRVGDPPRYDDPSGYNDPRGYDAGNRPRDGGWYAPSSSAPGYTPGARGRADAPATTVGGRVPPSGNWQPYRPAR